METESKIISFVLLLCTVFMLAAFRAEAGYIGLSEEAEYCLSCHKKPGNMFLFENRETSDVRVDPGKFRNSVHSFLPCSRCHPGFGKDRHLKRTFRSKLQYQTKASLVCRHCHSERQLREQPVHNTLVAEERKGSPIICTNCHGSHAIRSVTTSTAYANEEAYCMRCHGRSVTMSFRNGEALPVTINRSALRSSVHENLACSDCHYGFSSEDHPKRNFGSRRDYAIAASESCRRCHFDKYTKTMESIHYAVLSRGNLEAPVCTDCHGAHGIARTGRERSLIAKRCQRCHADIYNTYAASVHGNALFNENNQDVPVCADCHTAHMIEDPRTLNYREHIPDICSNCHANKAIAGKYGLSTDVVDSYLSDFHGITLKFYRLQNDVLNKPAKPMAVCTDCHGSHNITSMTGPDAGVVKANLGKRCRRCHVDAPVSFPNAWISHYEPSLSRAPLVFFINFAYKIFIPVLVIGLVLQILLHIWRFLVNR